MLLAKDGLPSGGSIGYELFDRGDGYLFSAFQQKISETRAMEGELARTITSIKASARPAWPWCCPAGNPSRVNSKRRRPASC